MKKIKPFGWADKFGYAFGDFGNDFTFMLSSLFMMKFYTDVMAIDAALVGLLMMLARFVDAFTDVAMGQIVDHSKPTKAGKFKPWIKRIAGPVAVASFMIYQSAFADFDYGFKVAWMFITYLLWGSVCYTAINIPYGSMVSAISANPDDRAQLSSYRTFGGTLANIVIGVVTPLFAYETVNGATVLSGPNMTIIAGVFSVCAIICYFFCYKLTTERVKVPKDSEKLNLARITKNVFTNRSVIAILVIALLTLLGTLSMQGLLAYTFPVYYNSGEAQSACNLISNIAVVVICVPLAGRLAAKFGKKEQSVTACILAGATFVLCYIIKPENPYVFLAFYVIAYIFFYFFNTIFYAMITDVIDDTELQNGVREDGTYYSVYSFARKLGQAFSSGMVGAILSAIGYTATVAENPSAFPQVLDGIFSAQCFIPAAGFALMALALAFLYPLNKKRVLATSKTLKERNK